MGLLYNKLGVVSSEEYLEDIALGYHHRSLEEFRKSQSPKYLPSAYTSIARSMFLVGDSLADVINMYDSALYYADLVHDTISWYETQIYKAKSLQACLDSMAPFLHFAIDSLHMGSLGEEFLYYYTEQANLDSIEHYLTKYAEDTTSSIYSKTMYGFFECIACYYRNGEEDAFEMLVNYYLDMLERFRKDAMSRTYVITQAFDVAREKEQTLQLQVEKQRLWIATSITLTAIIALILCVVLIVVRDRNEKMRLQLQAEQSALREAKIEAQQQRTRAELLQVNKELNAKKAYLQAQLKQRVALSSKLLLHEDANREPMPTWLQPMVDDLLLMDVNNWKAFVKEYIKVCGDIPGWLKQHYPCLSKHDIQYVLLDMMNLSISDIAVLLGTSEQAVYNRRLRIKHHLGDPTMDLDAWIAKVGNPT